jgi:hypothetical protein
MQLDEECIDRILLFASPHREKYRLVMAQLLHQHKMKGLFDELIMFIFQKVYLLFLEQEFIDEDSDDEN